MTQDTLLSSIIPDSSSLVAGYCDKNSALATTIVSNAAPKIADTVTISQKTLNKFRDSLLETQAKEQETRTQTTEANTKSLWETKYGLTNGTVTLSDGHTQVTTIKGSRMEILEYNGSTLVHKESGIITDSSAIKDVEDYDETGELTDRTHSELYFNTTTTGTTGSGALIRDIQKFKDGVLTMDIQDCMDVSYSYSLFGDGDKQPEKTPDSLEDLSGYMTKDTIDTHYYANIKEYDDQGNLVQDSTILKNTATVNKTNRTGLRAGNIKEQTTKELANATELSIDITRYDSDGNILRQASFSDSTTKGVSQTQHSNVSWYNQGKLQQQNETTYTTSKTTQTDTIKLRGRSGICETLGISEGVYSAATPLDAEQLLMPRFDDTSNSPDMFMGCTINDISSGNFSNVAALADSNGFSRPYSIECKTSLYTDGKLAVEKEDTQGAQDNLLPKVKTFRTVSGLTEDTDVAYLRSSSHAVKTFDDGVLKNQSSIKMQEEAVDDDRGITRTQTNVFISTGVGAKKENTYALMSNILREVDDNFKAAPENAQGEIETTLDDVCSTFSRICDTTKQPNS